MEKHHALARLRDRQDDYPRFTTGFRAPPDNNGSERDIRMAKPRQKVTAAFAPSPAPARSTQFTATCPPPPNTAPASSTPRSCSQKASPGCPPPDQTENTFGGLTSHQGRTAQIVYGYSATRDIRKR